MDDANNNNNHFRPLLRLLNQNSGWNEDAAYAAQKYSPLEFVLMMKADLATVQQVYETHPEALTTTVIHKICTHGYSPGVLGFLAEKLPEAVFEAKHGELPIHRAIENAPDGDLIPWEDDIMKLVEIYPQSVMKLNTVDYPMWELALSQKYSRKLYNFIFQQVAVHEAESFRLDRNISDWNDDRPGLDLDCVVGMNPVLSRVKTLEITDNFWKVEALIGFLRLVLQNPNLVGLTLDTGLVIADDNEDDEIEVLDDSEFLVNGDIPYSTYQYLTELIPHSGIESLSLVFGSNTHALPRLDSLLWALVLRLPQLKKLSVHFWDQKPTTFDPLKQLLESSGTLETLEINFSSLMVTNNCMTTYISPVIDGFAMNSVLKHLSFAMILEESPLSNLQERLFEILQDNTTLVEFQHRKRRWESNSTPNGWEKVEYLAGLNSCGRAVARDPSTTLKDFVPLLHQESFLQRSAVEQSNIMFGLLRESPGLWCANDSHGASGKCPGSRKRKRRQLENSRVERK